ncbi:hypothetical protein AB205_0222150 [Aquarana catesbeiana]|uniref:Uncharacterized protein n=1 Tax=Aquarana catesbeiana TaxID=8400 RepID=A0A2G9QGT3_AQUCT|nr:hypothetical protein AB205_0222150 [Aquarana catesbeiana]
MIWSQVGAIFPLIVSMPLREKEPIASAAADGSANPPQRPLLSETRPPAEEEDTGVMAAIYHNKDIPLQTADVYRHGAVRKLLKPPQND